MFKKIGLVIGGIVALLILCTLLGSFRIIDSGTVGIKKNLGQVESATLPPGLHFFTPWVAGIDCMDVKLRPFICKAESASKDLQHVTTEVTIQHSINPSMAAKGYVAVGTLDVIDATIVGPAIQETVKAVTARYTAEELVTKRELVKTQVHQELVKFIDDTCESKGIKGVISINNVAITHFDFSEEFNKAIELKVQAEQNALKAENEKRMVITQSEAAKAKTELAAQAEAFQVTEISKARAAAIQREAAALQANPALVRLRAIEKWDGKMPTMMIGGNNSLPFINMPAPAASAESKN